MPPGWLLVQFATIPEGKVRKTVQIYKILKKHQKDKIGPKMVRR